jgi:hypothetical protein
VALPSYHADLLDVNAFIALGHAAHVHPSWADTSAATTDGHRSVLAARRAPQLVTLDQGMPDSFLVPA